MPCTAPDLLHTLGVVPELLSSCLSSWKSTGVGMRQLRLVSKDIGCAALQAVKSCSLQVGEGADPNPRQLAHLMRFASLKEVNLSVLVTSGELAVGDRALHCKFMSLSLLAELRMRSSPEQSLC